MDSESRGLGSVATHYCTESYDSTRSPTVPLPIKFIYEIVTGNWQIGSVLLDCRYSTRKNSSVGWRGEISHLL